MSIAHEIIRIQKSRQHDRWGTGKFGASRDHGHRAHRGLDIVTIPGEIIASPIAGIIVRETYPYKNDNTLVGVLIKGTGEWSGFELKIFYVTGLFCGNAVPGQQIGLAQNLQQKYPGITNHVHVEAKKNGLQIDPYELWQQSF
jgi:hypothetical protein